MSLAIDEAQKAYTALEVPVGCVITDPTGNVVAKTYNTKEQNNNSCDHAEILAIKIASEKANNWRLTNHSIFVTLEPCPMCLSAIAQARLENLYFGAFDPKGGAISLGYHLHNDPRLNHKVKVMGGIKQLESGKLLSDFFKMKRKSYKK